MAQAIRNPPKLTLDQKLKVLIDTAEGLQYLHSNNIIHRDIKSSNILLIEPVVDSNTVVQAKIADYGIAKITNASAKLTTSTKCGTNFWASPEVLAGGKTGTKSDIYSFGILMWEIFSEKFPFEEEQKSEGNLMTLIIQQNKRPKIDAIPEDVPNEICDLIEACWKKSQNDRPSIEEVLKVLKSVSF